jgi:hypothetical protein
LKDAIAEKVRFVPADCLMKMPWSAEERLAADSRARGQSSSAALMVVEKSARVVSCGGWSWRLDVLMTTSRERVAQHQHSALASLFSGDAGPDVEPVWLKIGHDALLRKRVWACSVAWPSIIHCLGSSAYSELFAAYVTDSPYPPPGGAAVDGRLFIRWLEKRRRVPDLMRLQALSFDVRYRIRKGDKDGRGLAVAFTTLRRPRYVIAGFRVPWVRRVIVVRVRLGRDRMGDG